MHYSVGDKLQVRINKIQDNGCYCTFLPLWRNRFGFMPKDFMPSCRDENGCIKKKVGDTIIAVINKITDRGIILSDELFFVREQERIRKKEEKAKMQDRINSFVSNYNVGDVFEAEVDRVLNSKVIISLGDIQGIIEKKDINWNEVDRLDDLLFEGETINAVFIKYVNNHLYFSIKHLNEKPYEDSLYSLSIEDLLQFAGHDSNVFIGQAKRYHYGLFIENLYSTFNEQKGKLLTDPIYGYNLRALVPNNNFNVEESKFYSISLKLSPSKKRIERNQLFQFIAVNINEADNPYKLDVNKAFQRNTTNPTANQRDAKLLDEYGKNMYSSKERMFFELIQNADDAASKKGVLVHVKTEGDYLILKHNGYSFDKDDFDSITTAANGTKKANENKTGYKGIGFKSVFTDSEQVFINTGGYRFKFDKNEEIFRDFDKFYLESNPTIINEETRHLFMDLYLDSKKQFDGIHSIPWQLEPIWVEDFPNELGEDFTSSNVAIALKLGENNIEGSNGYCEAIDDIISNPKFMLFLRNTKRIDFNRKFVSKTTKDGIITLKNSFGLSRINYFKREDFEISVSDDAFESKGIGIRIIVEKQDEVTGKIREAKFVDLHNHEIENIPKKIAINNSTSISFAIPIAEDCSLKPMLDCNDISLFAFLPTLVKDFRFPFYINANFILDPPRQRIIGDNPWNFYLMQEIARCMVKWSASLNEKRDKNALNILVRNYFDENTADTKQLAYHFNSAYNFAIESEAFILNYKGELVKQDEIIIDKTGLSGLVGANMFCQLLGTCKCLPFENIDSKILEENIFEYVEILKFEDVIGAIINNTDFNEWFLLAPDKNKIELYNWIKDNNIKTRKDKLQEFVSNLPLFQFGEDCISYKDINFTDYIITTDHIVPIKEILFKLGIVCSDTVFDENHPLYEFIELQNELTLFEQITQTVVEQGGTILLPEEKHNLFLSFKNFKGVGVEKLSGIQLFSNFDGRLSCLNELFPFNEKAPEWARSYMISPNDDIEDIQSLLREEFDLIWENIDTITIEQEVPINEIYEFYKWSDEKYTRELIDKYAQNDNLAELLSIVEVSGKETKEYYLSKIKRLDLSSSIKCYKDSYENRVLQLALVVFDEPSIFSSKIYFDGQCIKDFSVSDEVVCEYTQNGSKRKVKMSLSKILPKYRNVSDSINIIKDILDTPKDIDKFFETKPLPLSSIAKSLEDKGFLGLSPGEWVYNKGGNAFQYLFYVYYYCGFKGYTSNWVISIDLTKETEFFVFDMLDFLYDNKIDISTSPFTYRIKHYFVSHFFYSNYVFKNEQILPIIEKWSSDDKKKQYLKENGVKESSCQTIQFRQLFLEDKPIDFINILSKEELSSGIEFIATAEGYSRPFVGKNQELILIQLKNSRFNNLSDCWNKQKIEENSVEWDSEEYKVWIEDHYPRIYIYHSMLPRQLFYKDKLLLDYEDADCYYFYDKQTHKLFISDARKIEEVLFEVAKENKSDFDFEDYKFLCWEGKIAVTKEDLEEKDKRIELLAESNKEKDIIIDGLRTKLKLYENNSAVKVSGENSLLPKHSQYEAQIEAQLRLIKEHPNWTFPIGYGKWDKLNDKPCHLSTVNVKDDNDCEMSIVLKSYKKRNESFKINPEEWDWIQRGAQLLIYDGTNILPHKKEDLIRNQSNVSITFSTENLDIEDRISAFSEMLHYFKELHFDFDRFNISDLRNMYNTINEKQKTISDEDGL